MSENEFVGVVAEQIVSEALTMALTHMLLEAEGGNNTLKIMHALDGMKVSGEQERDKDIFLWDPRLSPPITKSVAELKKGKKVSITSIAEMPRITRMNMEKAVKKQQELDGGDKVHDFNGEVTHL